MNDIAERLRNSLLLGSDPKFYFIRNADIAEAAGEIERLTAALGAIRHDCAGFRCDGCRNAIKIARRALHETHLA